MLLRSTFDIKQQFQILFLHFIFPVVVGHVKDGYYKYIEDGYKHLPLMPTDKKSDTEIYRIKLSILLKMMQIMMIVCT